MMMTVRKIIFNLDSIEKSSSNVDQMNGNHSSNNVPLKKGKLSHENDDLSESLVGRPRRQASCVIPYIS